MMLKKKLRQTVKCFRMVLKVIATGSSGNSYLLTANDGAHLLIECGVTIKRIKRAINFNLEKVAGCIVTHGHQ